MWVRDKKHEMRRCGSEGLSKANSEGGVISWIAEMAVMDHGIEDEAVKTEALEALWPPHTNPKRS